MATNGLEFELRILKMLLEYAINSRVIQGRAISKVVAGLFGQCRIFFRTTPRVRFFHSISACTKNFAPQPPITFHMVRPLPYMSKLPFNNFFCFYFFNQPVPGS